MSRLPPICTFFFFNDTATTEIYTLSLHDALPICPLSTPALQKITAATCIESSTRMGNSMFAAAALKTGMKEGVAASYDRDLKSTRLNSSHGYISYAVFCLKKKKQRAASNTYDTTI